MRNIVVCMTLSLFSTMNFEFEKEYFGNQNGPMVDIKAE